MKRIAVLVLVIVACTVAIVPKLPNPVQQQGGLAAQSSATEELAQVAYPQPVRPHYKYAFVKDGITSVDDFCGVKELNPVVAYYTRSFGCALAWEVTLSHPINVYIAYVKDGRVQWTKTRSVLPAGTAIITDGLHSFLMRCGNQISWIPMVPVGDVPPTEINTPIEEPPVEAVPPTIELTSFPVPPTPGTGGPETNSLGLGEIWFGGFEGPGNKPVPTPEPGTWALLGLGLLCVFGYLTTLNKAGGFSPPKRDDK